MTDQIPHINAQGLICPMPLMLLKQSLAERPTGSQVTITVTDVHAELDFETWCARFGHQLKMTEANQDQWQFLVTKA